jgi:hypothetical protein
MADRAHLERLHRELADSGKLIEAGFVSLRIACDLVDAPADQIRKMRMAFFAGAQHLFASMMIAIDSGSDPTDADMRRMDLIDRELETFIRELELRHFPTKGSA